MVLDGDSDSAGRFLIAQYAWTAFKQGPIFHLDLSATPHDRVRLHFDLYTLGDWRWLQSKTGGPQHRLMFFDSKASSRFSYDTTFTTVAGFQQSWPDRNGATHPAAKGAESLKVDSTGRFRRAHRWSMSFEYPSDTSARRCERLS